MKDNSNDRSLLQKLPPIKYTFQIKSVKNLRDNYQFQSFKAQTLSTTPSISRSTSQSYTKKVQKQFKGNKKKLPAIMSLQTNLNQKNYILFLQMINYSNKVKKTQVDKTPYYVSILKGNNHYLIQSLFKQRWWWKEIDGSDLSKIHFQWGQLRNNRIIKLLEPYGQEQDNKKNASDFYQLILSEKTMRKCESDEFKLVPQWIKNMVNKKDICLLLEYMERNNLNINQITSVFDDKDFHMNELKELSVSIMHNHIEDNWNLGNKKALFYTMKTYYSATNQDYTEYMPITFHITNAKNDKEYAGFLQFYKERSQSQMKNIWIIKPGEMTNRGTGITVCKDLASIDSIITSNEKHPNGKPLTYILQLYIDNPLLYKKRKFDIRSYMLVTSVNGILKGYWYDEGYIRTSSKEFDLGNLDVMIHLTNDAVQQNDQTYGKYESGNKVSFSEFQAYLDSQKSMKVNFYSELYSQMESIALDTIKASHYLIDPNRRSNSFELYGLDFMIDSSLKVFLIEVNTNPCLEQSCPLLTRIIPPMVNNVLRITVDSQFPPPEVEEWPERYLPCENVVAQNRFRLIFDEAFERLKLKDLRQRMKKMTETVEFEDMDEDQLHN